MQRRFSDQNRTQTITTVVAISLVVPLLATLSAFFGPYSLLPYVAVAGSIAVFALPLNVVIIFCLLSASLIAGVLEYFGGVSQGFWLPYLMGLLLALRGFSELFRRRTATQVPGKKSTDSNAVQSYAFLYIFIALFGIAATLPTLNQAIIGTKNYFFLWGIMLVLIWSPWQATSSQKFWTAIVVIASLQTPFTLYQRFVVATRRHESAAWDSIVGTLGGDPSGGGNSAAMAFVCCVAIAVIALRMRDRQLKIFPGVLLLLLSFLPIALAEVKAAFVWLIIVFTVLVWRQLVREPLRALSSILIGGTLLMSLGLTYMVTYKDQMGSSSSLQNIYDKQIKYSIDPNEYSSQYRRLGRITLLVYWWQQHDLSTNPLHMLLGHGLGASRSVSSLGVGELARRLPYAVDGTAASALLWDVGLLGALAFAAMLGAAALGVFRLAGKVNLDPILRESTSIAWVVLLMTMIGLIYNKDAIDNPTVQLLMLFSVAQLFVAQKLVDRNTGRLDTTAIAGTTAAL